MDDPLNKGLELAGQEIYEQLVDPLDFGGGEKGKKDDALSPSPLKQVSIEATLLQIHDLHPMKKHHLKTIMPWLCCCLKQKSASEAMENPDIEEEKKDTDDRLNEYIKEYGGE